MDIPPSVSLSVSDLDYEGDGTAFQAVATRSGVSIAQGQGPTELFGLESLRLDRFGYGGWLNASFFIVESGAVRDASTNNPLATVVYSYSVGDATSSIPTGTGSATWTGTMARTDVSATATPNNRIQGDAEISIDDLLDPAVDVEFTNIVGLATGSPRDKMTWNDITFRTAVSRTVRAETPSRGGSTARTTLRLVASSSAITLSEPLARRATNSA